MATCPVCKTDVNEDAARAETGLTAHGASEVDPDKGTRRFYDGVWYYFDTLNCSSKFILNPSTYLEEAGAG